MTLLCIAMQIYTLYLQYQYNPYNSKQTTILYLDLELTKF